MAYQREKEEREKLRPFTPSFSGSTAISDASQQHTTTL
jgi:hypothetical protein